MSERRLPNWLNSYVEFASVSEAPKIFHFWAGVSAIGGALRRHVWFDQIQFIWYPGFYIVYVGHPGVVTKSTAAGNAMSLLRSIPGIHFGPDEVTWQQLVASFSSAHESFEVGGLFYPQSAITIFSSEFGMFMDFKEEKFVNLLITMWDGLGVFRKETKATGIDSVEAPFVNIIACTTPQWIKQNMNQNTIGGGFTSRCVFVYGEKKEKPIAFIEDALPAGGREKHEKLRSDLLHDLEWISANLFGKYTLTPEAKLWATGWYNDLWENQYNVSNPDFINNYLARKQAHMIKLAMVIAASQRDNPIITYEDIRLAEVMLNTTEENMKKVFHHVGATEEGVQADKIREYVKQKGEVPYVELIKLAQLYWPRAKDFEDVMAMFHKSGEITLIPTGGSFIFRYNP